MRTRDLVHVTLIFIQLQTSSVTVGQWAWLPRRNLILHLTRRWKIPFFLFYVHVYISICHEFFSNACTCSCIEHIYMLRTTTNIGWSADPHSRVRVISQVNLLMHMAPLMVWCNIKRNVRSKSHTTLLPSRNTMIMFETNFSFLKSLFDIVHIREKKRFS